MRFARGAAWQCADILTTLDCKALYAVLGNHDFGVGAKEVTAALGATESPCSGTHALRSNAPAAESGSQAWTIPEGHPNPDLAIPESIRNVPNEPVILLCHAPDYADHLLAHPVGQAVDLMLSGHSHGGRRRWSA